MVDETAGRPAPLPIRRNMLFNTVGSLTYQGCLWLVTVLVVILSDGYYDSGVLSLAMTVGNMFVPIATYSMRAYQASDVDGTYQPSAYVAFRFVTMALATLVMVPYAVIVSDAAALPAILLFLLFKADESFVDVLYGIDQRYERMDYIGVSQLLRGIILTAAFCVGLLSSGGVTVALLGMFVSCLAVTLLYDVPHARRFCPLAPSIALAQIAGLLRECAPIALSNLLVGMVVSVARQYYGNAFGLEELGRYAAVATPAVIVQALARYLYNPVLVPLANAWSQEGKGAFARRVTRIVGVIVALAIASTVLGACLAHPILTAVYGQDIAPYTPLFWQVLVCVDLMTLLWFLSDVLVVCRDLRGVLMAGAVSLACCLALVVPLERGLGMAGVNVVVGLATLVAVAVAAWRLVRLVRSVPPSAA